MAHVPIERTFLPIEANSREPDLDAYFTWFGIQTGVMTWEDLLKNRLVVVLGEAGIGKTTEFRQQAARLNKAGHTAFFLRIETLLDRPLAEAFDPDSDATRFEEWRAQEKEAFFFLDSVDEARLDKSNALDLALRSLRKGLGQHERRARLFLSCRASDWHDRGDRALLDERFSPPSPPRRTAAPRPSEHSGEAEATPTRVVRMRGLNSEQVAALARALGLEAPQSFTEAIAQSAAWAFAQRPQDVAWLVPYWKQEHQIGTLRELVENNVRQKLREWNNQYQRTETLSPEEAREGAETLAAALVLCGRSAIFLPGLENPQADASTLESGEVLPRWSSPRIKELLTRAVFDRATYRRVRVHHRTVRDYLAARWLLHHFQAQQRSSSGSLRLCTREAAGRKVVLKPLRGVLGWMASLDEQLREKVIDVDPGLLLQEGDPAVLSDSNRQRLLQRLVEQYADRARVMIRPEGAMLRRFVSPALAPTIQQLLESSPRTEDVRELLLEMVALGELRACSALALARAMDPDESTHVRRKAVHAVAACDVAEHCKQLVTWALHSAPLHDRIVEELLDNLFPKWLGVGACIRLLEGIELPAHYLDASLVVLLEQSLAARCPEGELEPFFKAILGLRTAGDSSLWYDWVPGAITHLLIRLLDTRPTGALPLEFLARALKEREARIQAHRHQNPYTQELSAALRLRPDVRRHLFWSWLHSRPGPIPWNVQELLCVDAADIAWLIEGAVEEKSEQARTAALHVAVDLWWKQGGTTEKREEMLRLARDSPQVRAYLEERTQPHPLQAPNPTLHEPNQEREERRKREAEHSKLLGRLDELSSGRDVNTLAQLCTLIAANVSKLESHRYAQSRWDLIAGTQDKEIVEAGKRGCKRFWRTWTPQLPSQLSLEHEAQLRVGLSGLQTELEEGLEFSQLSASELESATRYALGEHLWLPRWFPDLFEAAPVTVESVLTQAVAAEFAREAQEPLGWSLLRKLEETPAPLEALTTRLLLDALWSGEPRREQVLEETLSTLRGSTHADWKRLASLARRGMELRKSMEEPGWFAWLTTWLHVDAASAWDFVEQWLQQAPDEAAAADRLVRLAVRLHKYRTQREPERRASFYAPAILRRMILALYRHHPPEAGERQSFLERDSRRLASEFRDHLCGSLSETAGDEAQQVLLSLAQEPSLESHRDYLLYLADLQAEGASNFSVWSPQDFVDFTRGLGKTSIRQRVFLSYRRANSYDMTSRIRDWLEHKIGRDNVFKDDMSIPWGADFLKEIETQLAKSDALLVIIDEHWVSPRLHEPEDFVRRELEFAFQRQTPVLPVLLPGAHMPREEQLPESLRPLCRLQSRCVRGDPDFHQDMEHLFRRLP